MADISVTNAVPEISTIPTLRTQFRHWDTVGEMWDSGNWDEDMGAMTGMLSVSPDRIEISVLLA